MTPMKLSVLAGMLTVSLVACTAESPEQQDQGTQQETMRQPPTDTQQGQGNQPGTVPPSDDTNESGQTGDTGSMDQGPQGEQNY